MRQKAMTIPERSVVPNEYFLKVERPSWDIYSFLTTEPQQC